jgi:hypothetical protein
MDRYSFALDSLPDPRDYIASVPSAGAIPHKVSLFNQFKPDIGNQKYYNACTGFGSAGMLRVYFDSTLGIKLNISPWWIWWCGRERSGVKGTPNGVYIRELFKVFQKDGVILHNTWKPKSPISDEPPNLSDKYRLKIDKYFRLSFNTIDQLKDIIIYYIYVLRIPIGISIKITDDFNETDKTGVYNFNSYRKIKGAHWVYIEGFSKDCNVVSIANSYGTRWGNNGLFTIDIDKLFDCINEGWVIDQFKTH